MRAANACRQAALRKTDTQDNREGGTGGRPREGSTEGIIGGKKRKQQGASSSILKTGVVER